MTPFQEDTLTLIQEIFSFVKSIWCYFFGHKYGNWELYINKPIGALRWCNRCDSSDHDSQMSRVRK